MAKEVYLYSGIYDFTAEALIEKMEEAAGEDITLRIMSGGGNVFAGWGICAKVQELGNVNIKVDGIAASMAGIVCLFGNKVECLNVSRFMLHRASAYVENDEDQKRLDSINKDIKTKMKAKLNEAAFKERFGYSIDDLFNSDRDCWMNAKDAKKIGLVDKVISLDPKEAKAYEEIFYRVAAEFKGQAPTQKNIPTQIETTMTLAELKAQHPALFEAAANEGFKMGLIEGAKEERDRIESFLTFMEVDPAGVKAGIDSGKAITAKQLSEFSLKSVTAVANLKKLEAEGKVTAPTAAAPTAAKTEKELQVEVFEKELFSRMNLGKKDKTKTVFGYMKYVDQGGALN